MSVTINDIQDFNRFAERKLSNGGADSIEQLAREWAEARELTQLAEDIAESEADIEAGRVKPLDKAFADIRKKLG